MVPALTPAADEEVSPVPHPPEQLSDGLPARPGVGGLTGGEDGIHPQFQGRLQRLKGVPAHIEGPVEGDVNAAGSGDHLPHGRPVQGPVGPQGADDHGVGPLGGKGLDLPAHDRPLRRSVEKVAEPGADQHIDGEAAGLSDGVEQGQRGGGAPDDQVGAELQPVRTAPGRRLGGLHRVHAGLQYVRLLHLTPLPCQQPGGRGCSPPRLWRRPPGAATPVSSRRRCRRCPGGARADLP